MPLSVQTSLSPKYKRPSQSASHNIKCKVIFFTMVLAMKSKFRIKNKINNLNISM